MTTAQTDIRHHLTEALLTAYSAGALPEAFSLVAAAHVSMCDECRARLGALDAVGGAMLTGSGCVDMNAGALDRALATIMDDPVPEAPAPRRATLGAILPAPVRDYVGGDLDAVRWTPLGMGVRQAVLASSASGAVRLFRIPAGAAMPDHGHRGMELTMVLSGAFADDGVRFGPGDVEVADEAVEHTPIADPGQDCICLAATDARLRFRGWLPRLAQPFLGV